VDSTRWFDKLGQSGSGFWRRLPAGHEGHGPGGEPTQGKTWVHKNLMRPTYTPKKHQSSFIKSVTSVKQPSVQGSLALHGTGTGKTFSAIGAFEELKGAGKAQRALVIVPASLRNNFLDSGVKKFTSSKGRILSRPEELPADVEYAVVSYAAFRRNPKAWIDKVKPDTIIADEVQRAISESSQTHKSLLWARKQVPRFMGLTASPISNEPAEIVPLLQIASGGTHPLKTRKQFRKEFTAKRTSPTEKGIFGGKVTQKKVINFERLKRAVGPSIHYVEDLDATEKPVKNLTKVPVPMSKEQIKLYRMAMKGVDPKIVAKIKAGEPVSQRDAMGVFTRLMRARQASNSLHTVSRIDPAEAAERTPKIRRIVDEAVAHLEDTPDGQVVMYTNLFHGGVDVLSAALKKKGISFGVFAGKGKGGITEESRQKDVEDYQAGKKKVLLITSAGAEGLSLGNTTMVQVVDGHYNPERTLQAEARGIRAGGLSHRPVEERKVQVRRYVSTLPKTFWQKVLLKKPEKSVGEWVYSTAEKKEQLNKQLRAALKARSEHEERRRDSALYRMTRRNP